MIWQDAVLTAGSLVFLAALLPMLRSAEKPPLTTSGTTGIVLLVFAYTYATLGALFGAATTASAAAVWLALAWQRIQKAGTFNRSPGGN